MLGRDLPALFCKSGDLARGDLFGYTAKEFHRALRHGFLMLVLQRRVRSYPTHIGLQNEHRYLHLH